MAESSTSRLSAVAVQYFRLLNIPITTTTIKEAIEQNPYYPNLDSISQVLAHFNIPNIQQHKAETLRNPIRYKHKRVCIELQKIDEETDFVPLTLQKGCANDAVHNDLPVLHVADTPVLRSVMQYY